MSVENSPWTPAPEPALQWTDAGEPRSGQFDDLYFSSENGLAESRYVFLSGNQLPERMTQPLDRPFTVAETGFGTGLNFLACWQAWRALPSPRPRLHFLSVEQYPLRRHQLQRALSRWPELSALAAELLDHYPPPLRGEHRLLLAAGDVTLDLWFAPAAEALANWAEATPGQVDAWFLDGFAPSHNAAMWQAALIQDMARASRHGATFATFTAASQVRRNLQAAGFDVRREQGYGGKRERLLGSLPTAAEPSPAQQTPWHLPLHDTPRSEQVLILGAGLAGCLLANALARRGRAVTVLDSGAIADGASGNRQGILYTRLSPRHNTLTDFALQGFCFATRLYARLLATDALRRGTDGDLCGCFHQGSEGEEMDYLEGILAESDGLAAVVRGAAVSDLLGIEQTGAGYWFERAGWLDPGALCHQQLAHPLIEVREHCGELALEHDGMNWQAVSGTTSLAQAPLAVICIGAAAATLTQTSHLPLRAIRGQTTEIPAMAELRAAFCHKGYVAPASASSHCIGATFTVGDEEVSARVEDSQQNLAQLAAAVPQWRDRLDTLDAARLPARVGWRCASPDYLPVAGPVPDADALLAAYAGLRRNAKRMIDARAPNLPGLYISSAHGSRGLTSAPLCAELIASQVCNEPLPLSSRLQRAVSPARFLVRDLARNRR
jgi:tRNA 5-methylaminomethyl-2-thiouridine biosynthesis bifunctional protein